MSVDFSSGEQPSCSVAVNEPDTFVEVSGDEDIDDSLKALCVLRCSASLSVEFMLCSKLSELIACPAGDCNEVEVLSTLLLLLDGSSDIERVRGLSRNL